VLHTVHGFAITTYFPPLAIIGRPPVLSWPRNNEPVTVVWVRRFALAGMWQPTITDKLVDISRAEPSKVTPQPQ